MKAGASASRTAVLVCQGRAVAHGRIAVDRFDDPVASLLLREAERAAVERARTSVPPTAVGERWEYETLRACAEVMVPRTVAIDDAVRARGSPQLVILGAGLDGRAWRMPDLSATEVYEVDHPASQQDKRERASQLQARSGSLRFVPVDFARDGLASALAAAGHQASEATTWIWEGVVPYLTKAQVGATLEVVSGLSAPGGRLIVNYQAPNLAAAVGRVFARAMSAAARQPAPFAGEPRRSTWTEAAMGQLLDGHGWAVVDDDDLVTLSDRLPITVDNRRSLSAGRVVVADR